MTENKTDWIQNYGFILVAFAHMTDWKLLDCELQVIQEKMEFMVSNSNNQYTKDKNFEKAIDNLRPPIFWKDKSIFLKQIKKWSPKKLLEAKEILFNTEVLIKTNASSNNNTLIKNLIINLYNKAISTS